MMDQPYFMTNEEWFYFDYEERKHKLTEKAPHEAVQSYEEYYNELKLQTTEERNDYGFQDRSEQHRSGII